MVTADKGVAADTRVRLDKWLWAARFYKTRSLATEAVNGGKVHVNEQRAKPSRGLQPGDRLDIQRGPYRYTVVVKALSERRGPASEAVQLYDETAASVAQREALATKRRLAALATPQPAQRPDKKARRQIIRFIRRER